MNVDHFFGKLATWSSRVQAEENERVASSSTYSTKQLTVTSNSNSLSLGEYYLWITQAATAAAASARDGWQSSGTGGGGL